MAKPTGNPPGCPEKLYNDELKERAYNSYCKHIASGLPQDAWYFDEDGILLTWETMENYFKRYPEYCVDGGIFDPAKKKVARSKNYQHWFGHVAGSAIGTNEKASTASLQMIMRNIHKWDAKQEEAKTTPNEYQLKLEQEVLRLRSLLNSQGLNAEPQSQAGTEHSSSE